MEALVCDLDGVVYRESEPVSGAVEVLSELARRGVVVVFATNHSSLTVEACAAKLAAMGLVADPAQIVTSAVALGEELSRRDLGGRTAVVVGKEGLRRAVREAGLVIEDDPECLDADFVVVGYDDALDYEALARATLALRRGATFIAANTDPTLPTRRGHVPATGAIVAALTAATGRTPEVMGKPHPPMMRAIQSRLGGARRVVAIGDTPATDLAGAARMGWKTVLVLSGVTGRDGLEDLPMRPDVVLPSLKTLMDAESGLF